VEQNSRLGSLAVLHRQCDAFAVLSDIINEIYFPGSTFWRTCLHCEQETIESYR